MPHQGWRQTLVSAQGAGPTLTAAAAASALPTACKFTIPANFFEYIGQKLIIEASGIVSTVVTTPGTFRLDHRMGGTVIADSQAVALDTVAAHTTVPWIYRATLSVRVVGNVAQVWYQATLTSEVVKGFGTAPVGVLTAVLPWQVNPPTLGTAWDATSSQVLDLFFTQTVTTGSFTLEDYSVESTN